MASLFEYEKEAIRIKVKALVSNAFIPGIIVLLKARRIDTGKEEYRKFSVDPNITSFEVLQSILCR